MLNFKLLIFQALECQPTLGCILDFSFHSQPTEIFHLVSQDNFHIHENQLNKLN